MVSLYSCEIVNQYKMVYSDNDVICILLLLLKITRVECVELYMLNAAISAFSLYKVIIMPLCILLLFVLRSVQYKQANEHT